MPEAPDFEALYRADPDPFAVRTSWYERRKRAVVLASLGRPRYAAAWDPASGTGDLALALSERCTRVVATDAAARAAELTAELCQGRPGVRVHRRALPAGLPEEERPVELVVLAEVLYYLPVEVRLRTYELMDAVTAPAGPAEVVAVHWRHHPHDGYLSGAEVTRELDRALRRRRWTSCVRHEDTEFCLAGWVRGGDPGEADQEPPRAGQAPWT